MQCLLQKSPSNWKPACKMAHSKCFKNPNPKPFQAERMERLTIASSSYQINTEPDRRGTVDIESTATVVVYVEDGKVI